MFFKFLEEVHKVEEKILHPDPDTTCLRGSSVSPLAISDNKGSRTTHCLKNRRNRWGKEPLFLRVSCLGICGSDNSRTIS